MADHKYKLSEIPKNEKLKYFWYYYKFHLLAAIICIVAISYFIKANFLAPKPDSTILIAHNTYLDATVWDDFKILCESVDFDANGDGENLCITNVNFVDEALREQDPQYYTAASQKLYASLLSGDYYIQVVDENMFNYLKDERLIATYKELSGYDIGEHQQTDDIKIPLSEIGAFDKISSKLPSPFYLTLRSRESLHIDGKEKSIEKHNENIAFIAKLAGLEKK